MGQRAVDKADLVRLGARCQKLSTWSLQKVQTFKGKEVFVYIQSPAKLGKREEPEG